MRNAAHIEGVVHPYRGECNLPLLTSLRRPRPKDRSAVGADPTHLGQDTHDGTRLPDLPVVNVEEKPNSLFIYIGGRVAFYSDHTT